MSDKKNRIICPNAPVGRIDPEPKYFLRRVNQLEMGAIAGLRVGLLSTYSPARRTQAWPRSHVEQ